MPDGINDNHVDEFFLKGLVHKSKALIIFIDSFPELLYQTMVKQCCEPLNVLNAVIFQVVMFKALENWENADQLFFTFGLVGVVAGYLCHLILAKPKAPTLGQDIKTFMFLTSAIAFLTPLLQSLTVKFSDDTIVLLVSILCIVHISAYDFQITAIQKTQFVRSATSLNAIFFAAILMASRL